MTTPEHQHHRTDDTDEVHIHHRSRESTHTRWIVAAVGTALMTLLGFFANENYRMMNARIDDQKNALHNIVSELNTHQTAITEMQTNQKVMLETQRRIEEKLDLVLARRSAK